MTEDLDAILSLMPELQNKKFSKVNLNEIFRRYASDWQTNNSAQRSQTLIDFCNKVNNGFTYGGWMENREFMWKGTYMDENQKYIHLGIDINIPAGTRIITPTDGKVVDIYKDQIKEGEKLEVGWGTRVILKPTQKNSSYLILCHLKDTPLKSGEEIAKGTFIGEIGTWPLNGNVWQHLHVQAVDEKTYIGIIDLEELDGYASTNEQDLKIKYPNPLVEISKFI